MDFHVPVEVGGRPEAFIADVAHVVPLVGVAPHVYRQRVFPGERLAAVLTPMWPENRCTVKQNVNRSTYLNDVVDSISAGSRYYEISKVHDNST